MQPDSSEDFENMRRQSLDDTGHVLLNLDYNYRWIKPIVDDMMLEVKLKHARQTTEGPAVLTAVIDVIDRTKISSISLS